MAAASAFVPATSALLRPRRPSLPSASSCTARASPTTTICASATPPQPRPAAAALATFAAAAGASLLLALPSVAATSSMRLPPIDRSVPDATRCTPKSSAIGQANAARDSLLDLRQCDLRDRDLSGYDLSGAILEKAVMDGSKFVDAMLSKSYAPSVSCKDCDFTNAVVDRAYFDGSDLRGATFGNAVLSDTTFEGADLGDTDWSDAYIGDFTQRAICKNPTLKGENKNGMGTRESLGCR